MRQKIREEMRFSGSGIVQEQVQVFTNSIAEMCYSGSGIILRHPIVFILHAVDGLKEKMKK